MSEIDPAAVIVHVSAGGHEVTAQCQYHWPSGQLRFLESQGRSLALFAVAHLGFDPDRLFRMIRESAESMLPAACGQELGTATGVSVRDVGGVKVRIDMAVSVGPLTKEA